MSTLSELAAYESDEEASNVHAHDVSSHDCLAAAHVHGSEANNISSSEDDNGIQPLSAPHDIIDTTLPREAREGGLYNGDLDRLHLRYIDAIAPFPPGALPDANTVNNVKYYLDTMKRHNFQLIDVSI